MFSHAHVSSQVPAGGSYLGGEQQLPCVCCLPFGGFGHRNVSLSPSEVKFLRWQCAGFASFTRCCNPTTLCLPCTSQTRDPLPQPLRVPLTLGILGPSLARFWSGSLAACDGHGRASFPSRSSRNPLCCLTQCLKQAPHLCKGRVSKQVLCPALVLPGRVRQHSGLGVMPGHCSPEWVQSVLLVQLRFLFLKSLVWGK